MDRIVSNQRCSVHDNDSVVLYTVLIGIEHEEWKTR